MTLSLRTDPAHPDGGFALLEGVPLDDVSSVTIENCFSNQYLGEDGKWGRRAFALPVEPAPGGGLSLGPHIVDHVDTDLQVELRSGEGRTLGKLFWTDVIPSRNPGSVTSAHVFEERRRRAQQQAADETQAAQQQATEEQAAAAERERTAAEAKASAEVEAARRAAATEETKRASAPIFHGQAAPAVAARSPSSSPAPRRSRWPLLALAMFLVLAAAGAALFFRPDMLRLGGLSEDRGAATPPPHEATPPAEPTPLKPEPPAPAPEPPAPAPEEAPKPEAPKPVDCTAFGGRIDALQGKPDAEKVALGEEALHAGCGSEAFQAFDAADPQTSEAAAWNLARFYDPDDSDPVYRGAASVHPDYAASYYRMWRDRSPRQAQALVRICEAAERDASLRRYCGR